MTTMTESKDESAQQDAYDYKRLHSYPLIRVSTQMLQVSVTGVSASTLPLFYLLSNYN